MRGLSAVDRQSIVTDSDRHPTLSAEPCLGSAANSPPNNLPVTYQSPARLVEIKLSGLQKS